MPRRLCPRSNIPFTLPQVRFEVLRIAQYFLAYAIRMRRGTSRVFVHYTCMHRDQILLTTIGRHTYYTSVPSLPDFHLESHSLGQVSRLIHCNEKAYVYHYDAFISIITPMALVYLSFSFMSVGSSRAKLEASQSLDLEALRLTNPITFMMI